jgi:hypothetical protein
MPEPSTALAALGGRNNIRGRARQTAGIGRQMLIRPFTAVERRFGSEPRHSGCVHSILLLVELTVTATRHLRDKERKRPDDVADTNSLSATSVLQPDHGSTLLQAQTRMPVSGNGLHDSTQQTFWHPPNGEHTRLQQYLFPLKV